MKVYYPSYYPLFTCIADRCKHNCCIGWEIDVDDDTLHRYQSENGAFGDRLRKNIDFIASPPSFILAKDERCPFLNKNNLCDIILTLGEDALCDICTLHPRFIHNFSDRTEIGLGLSCEEAGRIILSQKEPFSLICGKENNDPTSPPSEEEHKFFLRRAQLLAILTNRTLPLEKRKEAILRDIGGDDECIHPTAEVIAFCASLEHLDEDYGNALDTLQKTPELCVQPLPKSLELPLEQLLAYFLYRHLSDSEDTADFAARTRFSLFCSSLFRGLLAQRTGDREPSVEDLVETARVLSAEIEYSENNTLDLIDYFYHFSPVEDEDL